MLQCWRYQTVEVPMKAVRIIAPFTVSAVAFILSYLAARDGGLGYYGVVILGIGVLLAAAGIYLAARD